MPPLTDNQTFYILSKIIDGIFFISIIFSILAVSTIIILKMLGRPSNIGTKKILFGNVLYSDGRPASGATVFVEGVERRRVTDENGWFQLEVIKLPSYVVRTHLNQATGSCELSFRDLDKPIRLILDTSPSNVNSENKDDSISSPEARNTLSSAPHTSGSLPNKTSPTETDDYISKLMAKLNYNNNYNNKSKDGTKTLYCSFCGKSQHEVEKLIAGPAVYICDECTDLCIDIVENGDTNTTEDRKINIDKLCELTWEMTNPYLKYKDRQEIQVQVDEIANKVRSRRRERSGDAVADAQLIRVIGSGNFATVWEASPLNPVTLAPENQTSVAVKIFDQNKLTQGLMLWRFLRGIRAMQHLNKFPDLMPSSVVRLLSVDHAALAFSMEYHSGGDLENIRHFGWSIQKKKTIFLDILTAVSFAHANGVIHRDIKPANIVIDKNGRPVLTDFDIADLHFSRTQSVYAGSLGTPQFAAPEQLIGDSQVGSPTADIYSLGKLLFYIFREEAPPLGSTDGIILPNYLDELPYRDLALRGCLETASA